MARSLPTQQRALFSMLLLFFFERMVAERNEHGFAARSFLPLYLSRVLSLFSLPASRSLLLSLLLSFLLSLSLFRSLFLVHALPLSVALALLASTSLSLSDSFLSALALRGCDVQSRPSIARSGRPELTVLFAGLGSSLSAAMAT